MANVDIVSGLTKRMPLFVPPNNECEGSEAAAQPLLFKIASRQRHLPHFEVTCLYWTDASVKQVLEKNSLPGKQLVTDRHSERYR